MEYLSFSHTFTLRRIFMGRCSRNLTVIRINRTHIAKMVCLFSSLTLSQVRTFS